MAALSAIVTARSVLLPGNLLAGTLYVTEQSHKPVTRAARLAGFPAGAIRTVPSTRACTWIRPRWWRRWSTTGPQDGSRSV